MALVKSVTGYRFGTPTPLQVVEVQEKRFLSADAAQRFVSMREAAKRDNVELWLNTAWRSMEEQQALWAEYQSGKRTSVVARPGWSNHQYGTAVDISTGGAGRFSRVYKWLNENASKWNFYNTVPSEPWHWDYLSTETLVLGTAGAFALGAGIYLVVDRLFKRRK